MSNTLEAWNEEEVVLAWIVETQGSSFFSAGQMMLINESGESWGYLSPGCLEGGIREIALEVLKKGEVHLMDLDTERTYGCAGKLKILFHHIDHQLRSQIKRVAQIANETSAPLPIEVLLSNHRLKIASTSSGTADGAEFQSQVIPQKTGITVSQFGDCMVLESCRFAETISQAPRVLLLGASLVNQAIMKISAALPWKISWIGEVDTFTDHLAEAGPDGVSAVLIATHNFGRDTTAVMHALNHRIPYVGLIGPQKRRQQLVNELINTERVDLTLLDQLFSPAGLDLGGRQPSEVALSIVAEIQQIVHQRTGSSLTNRPSDKS